MESRLAYAHNFKFTMRDYDELVGYKKSAQDKRQLDTIKALWKMSLTVVNAMRPDITGDLDFLSLYYFIGCPLDTRRAWLPVLTKKAIVHAVNHGPQNRKEYEKWLEESIYNAIVQAAEENAELKGSPAVEEISVADAAKDAECAGVPAPAPGEQREGDNYIGVITDRCPLFNLPALMIQAACELDYSHEKTILTAYRLYAKKLISYPMVMQNTVPGGVWKAMLRNMEMLCYNTQQERLFPDESRKNRGEYHDQSDHPSGGGGQRLQSAHREAGGQNSGHFCAHRDVHCPTRFPDLDDLRRRL